MNGWYQTDIEPRKVSGERSIESAWKPYLHAIVSKEVLRNDDDNDDNMMVMISDNDNYVAFKLETNRHTCTKN